MNDILLNIKHLTVGYGKQNLPVLDDINFSIRRAKVCGIVGESGSGKSVTSLSVMGLLPPALHVTRGEILFSPEPGHQSDLLKMSPSQMNDLRGNSIGMIFQEPMTSLNPSMSCGGQIDELLRKHSPIGKGERKDRILGLFEKVRLPRPRGIYSSYPHQLSGGQRQRVMIAMALAANPVLLIADEPTTALDVTVQKSITRLLRELQEEFNISVIFISHDLRLIGEIADDIVVMKEGKLVEKNDRHAIFTNPVQPYTRGLLACQPPLDEKPDRLLTVEDFEKGASLHPLPENPVMNEAEAANENPVILSVKNLEVHYSRSASFFGSGRETVRAVDNVSLEIRRGETVGLAGESGCGKTTLGKTILRLIEARSGDIIYKGKNIAKLNRRQLKEFRKNVQVVFQDPYSSLNPAMSTGSMLEEVIRVHFPQLSKKQVRQKAEEYIVRAGMHKEDLLKYPHEFSGGQRQRIGIARALAVEPEFLILDESVSALDVSVQAQILNLLNDLKKDFQLSYLFISHDLAVVKYMSDRIIIMKEGKIEEEGKPEVIYHNPASGYTRELISSVPGYQNSPPSL